MVYTFHCRLSFNNRLYIHLGRMTALSLLEETVVNQLNLVMLSGNEMYLRADNDNHASILDHVE